MLANSSTPFVDVGHILKAKYFTSTSFLEASMGCSSFFILPSVWNACSLLEEELRWRVGNELKIKIVDKWLSRRKSFKISFANCTIGENTKVADLLDWGSRRCRVEMLKGRISMMILRLLKVFPSVYTLETTN